MRRISALIILLFFIAGSYGCERDSIADGGNAKCSLICIDAGIDNSPVSGNTRGAYSGTTFKKNEGFGICICVHEDNPVIFAPHQIGYGNIKVTNTSESGTAWSFYNKALGLSFPDCFLSTRTDRANADIYAYAPYVENVSDITVIPVDLTHNYDLMWAEGNGQSNRDIDPSSGNDIPVSLSFRHALCRLHIGFKLEYSGSTHMMNYITLKKSGSKSTRIYSKGTLNAMTGLFTPSEASEADSVRVEFNGTNSSYDNYGYFSNASGYRYFDYLLPQTDYLANNDLTLCFGIDGFRYEYPIKKADVMHSDGTSCGFRQGYQYEFNFQFDNYVHMKGITIQQDWTPDNIDGDIL